MAHLFVCPKCSCPHTEEEFRDSRFCRECGKFLTSRNRVKAPSLRWREQKTEDKEWRLFPYEPYPQQVEFMEDVMNVVGNRGVLVAEACNGFGKTVCALASILPMGRKIVYATRTHEQVRQVLLEVKRINKSARTRFSAVSLASRQHLCLNPKCKTLSAVEALEACRLFKESGQCPYKTEVKIPKSTLPLVLSINELRRQGRSRKVCPYFLGREASGHYTVIVAPYQYIFNRHIRRHVKLELSDRVLVFDEAHNADQIGQDVLSGTLSTRTLNRAKQELEAIDASLDFIDDLATYLTRKNSETGVTEPGLKFYEELKAILKEDKLSSFVSSFSGLVEEIQGKKLEKGNYPMCYLNGVLNFLELVDSSPRMSYVAVYRRSFLGFDLVEYRCLDPSLAIKPVVEAASGGLIMSGTLSPIELFTEILCLEKAEKRTYSAIADPENVRTIIDHSVTTKFNERNEEMIHHYGEKVAKLVSKIPHGVLIFFPQRKLMLKSLNCWERSGIMDQVNTRAFINRKPLFIEGIQALENRKVVERYKKAAKSERGAVLCGVFRGRNAEGSNFPHEEARGVILIGVPYADYGDPVVKAQIRYFNNKKRGTGDRWYVMDAFKAVNQALGRGIRDRDDWCNFVLMDNRYETHLAFVSKWAVANGIRKIA